MMVLLSAKTGLVEALLLDNGYLTDVRTAAAGAVAAKLFRARMRSIAAIFGAGVQARLQLRGADAGAADPRGTRSGRATPPRPTAAAAALRERLGI